jgi:hypothetical protein
MKHRVFRCASMMLGCLLLLGLISAFQNKGDAQERKRKAPPTPGPMLAEGVINLDTPDFDLSLVRSSQTVASFKPKGAGGFDFTPGDLLVERSQNGYYHLGDLDLRLRKSSSGEWKSYSTAVARTPVTALSALAGILAAADLTPTLPADCPLDIVRTWALESGKLVLRFQLKNQTAEPVQVGALGIPMIFNNVLTDRSLEQAHALCSFYDPYIGEDAGYLQVTRLSGHGPALLVVPDGKTPFEAYNPILDKRGAGSTVPIFTDPTPRGTTFEGFYDWMVHSQAYAENEWKKAHPWNPPTLLTLAPGASRTYGVKFLVADEIRNIEKTLAANDRPVAVGIPGYVLPMDIIGRLFLKYSKGVKSVAVEPKGAIAVTKNKPTADNWKAYTLKGRTWGRARLVVTYEDGLVQAIQYDVIKPAAQAVADMGHFLTTRQWFVDPNDPFKRSPSVMSYDREADQIVTQESRVWIAGLGDEAGSGSWLAAMMKELGQPDKEELDKLQQFVDGVLWGGLQYADGRRQYGVRKSLFYYQPDQMPANYYRSDFNWTSWTSWNKRASERVDRSFNYPHVAAAYWVLYRLARNHDGLITNHPWDWYLTRAYETSLAMVKYARHYARFGQMEGDVFLQILLDLKREKWTAQAAQLESRMRERAVVWRQEKYPFGSEMPWDSTGQEEVYAWTKYFGDLGKAKVTLDAILGYMPTLPHWGYNGSARRYWDFVYAGKYRRIERQLHHYGSGINAIPVLAEYREHPEDLYLLRVGYGGTIGALTDIDQEGFASCAFHSFPDTLKFDPYTGDYGPNFFGHAFNTATYIVDHPEFGWQAFGGDLKVDSDTVKVTPLDAFRMRVYVATIGLWLTLDAGKFQRVEVNTKTSTVRVGLDPANRFTPQARLRIEQPSNLTGVGTYYPAPRLKLERDAYTVPLKKAITWVELISCPGAGAACDEAEGVVTDERGEKLAIKRIDPVEGGFYAKLLDYHGIPIKAPEVVSDQAMYVAWRRLDRQLRHNPMMVKNLIAAGTELHILGKNQVTSDLPEFRDERGKVIDDKGNTIDTRTRGMGGRTSSCGEENLLELPKDRYFGRDICNHEFAHAIFGVGISSNVREEINDTYKKAMAKGLWKPAYASTNSNEYFAELTMWYFGNHGDMVIPGTEVKPGAEWLKSYDPDGYALLDKIYQGKAEVREVTEAERAARWRGGRIGRLDPPQHGVLAKQTSYRRLPIKSGEAVSDEALFEARRRVARLLRANPVILQNLLLSGAELQIIGKDQMTSDLPYESYWKGKLYDGKNDIDKRTRGMGELFASCGEENLLKLTNDRYFGRDICSHEFTHTIHRYGLSSNVWDEIERQYHASIDKGLWNDCYAATDSAEYIAEMIMWYVGGHGDWRRANGEMKSGPEWLKSYDPEGYALIDNLVNGKLAVEPIAYQELAPLPAEKADEISRLPGDEKKHAAIVFDNQTDQNWLCCYFDKEGKRTVSNLVLAHDKLGADSHDGAGWVVVNPQDGKVLSCYIAKSDHCRVVLKK